MQASSSRNVAEMSLGVRVTSTNTACCSQTTTRCRTRAQAVFFGNGSMLRTAMYNEQADRRSWASMKSLFDEVLT